MKKAPTPKPITKRGKAKPAMASITNIFNLKLKTPYADGFYIEVGPDGKPTGIYDAAYYQISTKPIPVVEKYRKVTPNSKGAK